MTAGRGTASPGGVASPFAGAGTVRALGRRLDWASTALGAPEHWPQSLRTAVDLCLGSAFPTFVWWGPSLVQLYNEAALDIVRAKHPAAFGVPATQAWADVWESVGPLARHVLATGEAVRGDDFPVRPERDEARETAWFGFSYGAVRDESGSVAGLFITAIETTGRVNADRIVRDQQALIDQLRDATADAAVAAERARASEALTSALVAHLPGAAVFVVDQSLHYLLAEGEALTAAGLTRDDLVGRTVGEALGTAVEADYAPFYRRALAGQAFSREHEDGGRVYLTRGAPLPDGAGQVHAALAVSTDITERRQVEESLRRSESRYRALFDSIDEGFCVIEMLFDDAGQPLDYRFLETNPAFARQTGIADAVGRRMREIAPAHEAHWFEIYGRVARTGEPTRFEARADALGRWYDVYAFRVGDAAEGRVAILFNDVGARKRGEAAVKESEARYRALATASADVVYSMSPDWAEMRRLDGRGLLPDAGEPSGAWLSRFIHPDDQAMVTGAIEAAVESRRPFELEHRVLRADGSVGWTSSRAVPVIGADGAVVEWIGTATDVTERRASDARLVTELARAELVQRLSLRLIPEQQPETLREEILDAAMALMNADFASLQMLEPGGERLRLLASRNMHPDSQAYWAFVDPQHASTCGQSFRSEGRVMVGDVEANAVIAGTQDLEEYRRSGIRAVQTTPLVSRSGRRIGLISTHWREPRTLAERDFRFFDILVRQLADLMERSQVDAALRESEARLAAMFESLPVGVGVVDAGGAIVLSNREMHRYLPTGVIPSRDSNRQPRWRAWDADGRLLAPDEFPGAGALRGDALLPGLEMLYTDDDGREQWTRVTGVPIRDGQGVVTGAAIVVTDVDRLKRTAEALRANEERQAFLLALSDALRPLEDPVAIQGEAARLLGEWLGADRALYADTEGDTIVVNLDWVRGVASMVGRYPASTWGEYIAVYLRGEAYVVHDVTSDPRIDEVAVAAFRGVDTAAFIGLGLVKGGAHVASFGVHSRTPRTWTAEEIELARETAERTWAAVERSRTEIALRESEAKYRTIFDSIDEGFVTHEVLYDDAGRPVDLRYLEMNPAYERHTGVRGRRGRTAREILPDFEDAWIEAFARVARTGESVRAEHYNTDTGRWYNAYLSRVGGEGSAVVAAVFSDNTDRKRAEATLMAAVARDAFLVRLADALRPLADPTAVQAGAMRVLGEHFGAVRAQLWEAEPDGQHFVSAGGYVRGMAPIPLRIRPDDFGVEVCAIFRAGQTLAVANTAAHPLVGEAELAAYRAMGIVSYVGVPLIKDGKWVAVLGLHRAEAHDWTPDEVAVVEETAERVWAALERARAELALRESEAKYRTIFDSIDEGFGTHEVLYDDTGRPVDIRYLDTNPAYARHTGVHDCVGRTAREVLPQFEEVWVETFAQVARTGEPLRFERHDAGTNRWYDVYLSRVGGEGSPVVAAVFNNVTARKNVEAALAAAAARDAFLVQLADALRSVSDPKVIEAEATRLLGEHLMVDRAYYVDIDVEAGTARVVRDWVRGGAVSVAGEYRLSEFGTSVEVLRRGERFVVSDTRTSPLVPPSERPAWAALEIVGFAGVPLTKGGRLLGTLSVTVDRPRVWHDWELELIEDVAGRIWASIEHARAESALRESETRYRHIVEGARDYAIFTTDPQATITSWSPGAETMFGWTEQEAVGQPFSMIFVPEDRARGIPERELALAADHGVAADIRWHLARDGSRVFTDGTTRALHDESGRLTGFLKVGQDETSRRALDDALRASEARYRTLAENIFDYAIFLLDADGIIVEWTKGAQHVKGYTAEEAIGQHVSLFYTAEDIAKGDPARELAEAAETGRAEREGWRVCKGGSRFWGNEIATAVRDGEGRLVGFTKISRNLTERRRAEQAAELARAAGERDALRRRLVEAEEDERRRLSRELHDEAGQHITALALGLQALSDVASPGSEVDRRAAELRVLAATLGRELHAIAVRLRPRALDDFGLEAALATLAEDWARQSGIQVDIHARVAAERLPDVVESALYRIVQEALANVARHSGAQRASVVVERRDGHVVTIVEDDGRGFDDVGGWRTDSGLGLLGMRERAALLGGSLDVESMKGGGTTLFVRIPVTHPESMQDGGNHGGGNGR